MSKELTVLVVKESLIQSVLSDIFTVGLWVCFLFVNHKYLGSSWVVELSIVVGVYVVAYKRGGGKIKEMTPVDALPYLEERLNIVSENTRLQEEITHLKKSLTVQEQEDG